MSDQRTFYVTTPIYYVTARPHLGSLYSTVLADVAARWHLVKGESTFLLTGTDEHGQKVAQAAQAAGLEPQTFVDGFIGDFQATWKRYGIHPTHFIRTTDRAHVQGVYAWIDAVRKKGDIYRDFYEGYYCTPCETFVTDTEGKAPHCPSCNRETVLVKEPCYFFRLSSYADYLLSFYREHPHFITPRERLQEVISFVEGGLKDLAISRQRSAVSWGIPFPGDDEHVVYVWADALMNYLSAIGYGDPKRTNDVEQWWPAQLQVLGKDIIRFHAVYWPAFLHAAGLAAPQKLLVHGWIKIGGEKMSKSLGNVVDPMQLADRYSPDVIRYYLTRHIAVTHDAPFSIEDLETRNNADLADDIGNLVQRIVALAHTRTVTHVTVPETWTAVEDTLWEQLHQVVVAYKADMEQYLFHRAYAHIWHGIALLNAYFHAQQPWKLTPNEMGVFERILAAATHGLSVLGILIWPVMPSKMEQLFGSFGIDFHTVQRDIVSYQRFPRGAGRRFAFTKGAALFPKFIAEESGKMDTSRDVKSVVHAETKKAPAHISIDEFAKVELVIGTIEAVEIIPKSDKLYKLTINLGSYGIRTICSGVRLHFAPGELLQQQVIVVANLAPRAMLGIASEGMVLFAEDAHKKLRIVRPMGEGVANGTRLR